MAKNILDRLPGILNKAMAQRLFRPAVLLVDGASTGPDWDPTPGAPVEVPCQALVENWSAYSMSQGLVAASDRKIMILSASMPGVRPEEGNRITISGETFSLVSDGGSSPAVTTDPAGAVWVCRGRA